MESVRKTPHNMFAILLAAGLFASFSGIAADAENAKECAPVKAHKEKSLKNYADQDKVLVNARKKLEQEKFSEAVDLFNEVLSILELEISDVNGSIARSRFKQVQEELFKARRAWGASLMHIARMAASEKRYDEAMRIASEAAARDTLLKDESKRFVAFCRGQILNDKLEKEQGISEYESKLNAKQQRIKTLLAEANTLYSAGDYMGAVNRAEQVLLLDQTNADATEIAGRAYRKIFRYGNERTIVSSEAMMAAANWQWVEPIFQSVGTQEHNDEGALEHDISKLSGAEKLDKIIFPTFNFDEFDLPSVIEFLQSRSKEYDPEGKGVVFENNLPRNADQVTVTMSLNNVPLSTILRVLCLKASEWKDVFEKGVKYTVSENGHRVTLSSGSAAGVMEKRIFSIPAVLYRMAQEGSGTASPAESSPETSSGGGEEEGGERTMASLTSSSSSSVSTPKGERSIPGEKWKSCFQTWLIDFPAGSSVFHDPQRSEITVTNTPENLQLIDVIIGQMSAMVDPLVLIEVKAVEISESDYQELGFDWAIANSTVGQSVDDKGNPTTQTILMDKKRNDNSSWILEQGISTLAGAVLSPLRSGRNTPIISNWNLFSNLFGTENPFGSNIPFTVNLTINALSQSGRTETVSAPKVITRATPSQNEDNAASVNMGKSYYFPDSWEALEVEIEQSSSDNSIPQYNITPPQPDFGDSVFVGTSFTVKPRLLADNKTIFVDLNVTAKTYDVVDGEDKWNIVVHRKNAALNDTYPVFMPRFNVRELKVNTHITDGETIIVGGMVESRTQTTNDKIPFLGDLPLIGRLFQSSTESIQRVNLLIFLSARLMKNDGTPLNPSKPTGMPDFNR